MNIFLVLLLCKGPEQEEPLITRVIGRWHDDIGTKKEQESFGHFSQLDKLPNAYSFFWKQYTALIHKICKLMLQTCKFFSVAKSHHFTPICSNHCHFVPWPPLLDSQARSKPDPLGFASRGYLGGKLVLSPNKAHLYIMLCFYTILVPYKSACLQTWSCCNY